MPVKSFGIFAAIIIPSNFLLVITLFPPAVIIYEKYFAKYKCCCFCPEKDRLDSIKPSTERGNDDSAQNDDLE